MQRRKDRRIGDEQGTVTFEYLGIRQPEQATHVRVFGFVQFEQLVALIHLEERLIPQVPVS